MNKTIRFFRSITISHARKLFFLTKTGERIWLRAAFILKTKPAQNPASPENLPLEERISRVQKPDFYGKEYFDTPKERQTDSGYEVYVPYEKDINLAKQAKNVFNPRNSLDVGCARGFIVSEQSKLGIDAFGTDFSAYAVGTADDSIQSKLFIADCSVLPVKSSSFDLVTCYETLEHLQGEGCIRAMDELARTVKDFLWISVPCLGYNDLYFPPGWPQGKIRKEYVHLYEKEVDFPDPALSEHLALDRNGFPIEGHVTIASFRWWTENFIKRGFIRRGDIEKKLAEAIYEIRNGGLNTMIFEKLQPNVLGKKAALEQILKLKSNSNENRDEILLKDENRIEIKSDIKKFDPGIYETSFEIALDKKVNDLPPWTQVIICHIRDKSGDIMPGLRTVRLGDFDSDVRKTFNARFGCNKPMEIRFIFSFPGRISARISRNVKIRSGFV
jgi:hypothetical protein